MIFLQNAMLAQACMCLLNVEYVCVCSYMLAQAYTCFHKLANACTSLYMLASLHVLAHASICLHKLHKLAYAFTRLYMFALTDIRLHGFVPPEYQKEQISFNHIICFCVVPIYIFCFQIEIDLLMSWKARNIVFLNGNCYILCGESVNPQFSFAN